MALIFHVAGDQLNARYARENAEAQILRFDNPASQLAVESLGGATVIGGQAIKIAPAYTALAYRGYRNFIDTATPAMSILLRHIPNFNGSPPSGIGLWRSRGHSFLPTLMLTPAGTNHPGRRFLSHAAQVRNCRQR